MIMQFFFALILATLFNTQLDASIFISNSTTTALTVQFENCCSYLEFSEPVVLRPENNNLAIQTTCCARHVRVTLQIDGKQQQSFLLSEGVYFFEKISGNNYGYQLSTRAGSIYAQPDSCSCIESCCVDFCYTLLRCCYKNPCFYPHPYTAITTDTNLNALDGHQVVLLWQNS